MTDTALTDISDAIVPEADPATITDTTESPQEAVQADTEVTASDDTDPLSEAEKRASKLAADLRLAKRRERQQAAELEVLRGQRQEAPDQELDRRARDYAAQMSKANEFNKACEQVKEMGLKEFGQTDFPEAVTSVMEVAGSLERFNVMVEAMIDAGDAHKLLKHLGDNVDILEGIASLPPHRMGAKLAQISAKLNTPKPKALSKAPAPIKPVSGGATTSETRMDELDMEAYAKARGYR